MPHEDGVRSNDGMGAAVRTVDLSNGTALPTMGQGTWCMGDDPATRSQEIEALREGIRRGMTLIDTAEMYGDGRSEDLVGEAISDCRDDVFLVSKVTPGVSRRGTIKACEQSLRRLGTDRLDLYLLHWPGASDFQQMIDAFQQLVADGKIRQFGVSNFTLNQLRRFREIAGGEDAHFQQLLYNLNQRGIEWELLPWLQDHRFAMMAYSPFDQGELFHHDELTEFARQRDLTVGQVALAWLLAKDQVIPIPKSSHPDRAIENAAAREVSLSPGDMDELDEMFPPPTTSGPLQIY